MASNGNGDMTRQLKNWISSHTPAVFFSLTEQEVRDMPSPNWTKQHFSVVAETIGEAWGQFDEPITGRTSLQIVAFLAVLVKSFIDEFGGDKDFDADAFVNTIFNPDAEEI